MVIGTINYIDKTLDSKLALQNDLYQEEQLIWNSKYSIMITMKKTSQLKEWKLY